VLSHNFHKPEAMRSAVLLALLIAPFADAIGPASMFANHVTSNFMLAKAAPAPPAPKQTGLGTRMVLGALGGMGASSVCHPLDVVRVQMQVSGGAGGAAAYKNPLDAAVQIVKRKGFFGGLYTGIDAAYLRQWYGPIREDCPCRPCACPCNRAIDVVSVVAIFPAGRDVHVTACDMHVAA